MKSFRLHVESGREFVQSVVRLLMIAAGSAAVCLAVLYFQVPEARLRVAINVLEAVVTGYFAPLMFCRELRQHYPKTRWTPLLAVALSVVLVGGVLRSLLGIHRTLADDASFPLAFTLPLGLCIAVFLIIHGRKPDVTSAKTLEEKDVATDPDRLELLWLLRQEFDDALLEEMAGHGAWGMEEEPLEARKVFGEILRTGEVPCPLEYIPAEPCNLLRHGAVLLNTPLSQEERRNRIMRLFATWILVNNYTRPHDDPNGFTDGRDCDADNGDEITLCGLTGSSVALGPAFVRASIRFVSWARSKGKAAPTPVENLFYLLSLLVLRCALPDAEEIAAAPALYDALVFEEQEVRRQQSEDPSTYGKPSPTWLFGVYRNYDLPELQQNWVSLGVWVLDNHASSCSGGLDPRLAELKHRLVDGLPKEEAPRPTG